LIHLKKIPFLLDNEAVQWVYTTLKEMSIEDKVGQLFCVLYKTASLEELEYTYRVLRPGGCMYRTVPLQKAVEFSRYLQEKAKIPLLIAANLEKGGNGIVSEGTLLGSPLQVAATNDLEMAGKLAHICAEEGKAVGANWAFAPIVDIDCNFRNPITNTRTFGSDPAKVKAMGLTYIKAVQAAGMAVSIKHFPGDGCDERDQHLVTSINDLSCVEWDASYGDIYRACIDAGALTCMVGHIMQPAYTRHFNEKIEDADILPCSLSPELMQGLLREKLGFNGLIVTDATTMAGFTLPMTREKAVPYSVAAGADMFLFARNLKEDFGFMMQGVRDGIITEERLDEAVIRILGVKAALGLYKEKRLPDLQRAKQIVGCEKHKKWAAECADKAITLVKQQPGVLPLSTQKYRKILFYPIESSGGVSQYAVKEGVCGTFQKKLEEEGFDITVFTPPTGSEGHTPPTTDIVGVYDLIIYAANLATKSNQTTVRIEWAQPMGSNCMHYLNNIPTVFISLENPYHLFDVPRVKTFINTYNSSDVVLDELVEKLMGRSTFKGSSPVDAFCGRWDTRL